MRMAIGALLILFSLYNLIRPKLPEAKRGGQAADVGVGFLNGVVGGSTGLAGILIVIWSAMPAWPSDEQRAAFQPTGVATFLITLIALGGSGIITGDILKLFALGLPALAIGTWAGWKIPEITALTTRKVISNYLQRPALPIHPGDFSSSGFPW
jgi:uncharacterized membrane protein YfcA